MKKYERLIKKLNISKETELHVPVFSEETFLACKMGNINDFYDLECVEDMAFKYLLNLKDTTLEKVTFGVIDEEYFKYLLDNGLDETKQNREDYIKNLSPEKRQALWEKNEYNYGYDWGIIPIILENISYENLSKGKEPQDVKYEISLNDLQKQQIERSIWETFNQYEQNGLKYNIKEKDIYVSPYVIPLQDFSNDELIDELFDSGCNELHGSKNKKDTSKLTQIIKKEKSLDFFGIFVMYRYQVPFTIDNNYIERAKQMTVNNPDIDIDKIESILSSSINVTFDLLTSNLIYSESIPNVIAEFIEILVQQIDKKTNALNTMNESIAGHCKKKEKNDKKKKKK